MVGAIFGEVDMMMECHFSWQPQYVGKRFKCLESIHSLGTIRRDVSGAVIAGSLSVKLRTVWRDEKQREEEAERRVEK